MQFLFGLGVNVVNLGALLWCSECQAILDFSSLPEDILYCAHLNSALRVHLWLSYLPPRGLKDLFSFIKYTYIWRRREKTSTYPHTGLRHWSCHVTSSFQSPVHRSAKKRGWSPQGLEMETRPSWGPHVFRDRSCDPSALQRGL